IETIEQARECGLRQDLPVSRPDARPSADSAAYVIHTSGSTGQA
ncbi:non-ribosomal peptide synthase:amino acid adenylation, partial [Pseudomonas syringae pv. japonica str. M301072]